jgi:hypothetical protein
MSAAASSFERIAWSIIEREWESIQTDWDASSSVTGGGPGPDLCPVSWLLHDLLALVADAHDQPIEDLAPRIRQIIIERQFINENGDTCLDAHQRDLLEAHVAKFVQLIDRVRRLARHEGEWSNVPVTPQMFG